jgi:hypothetical protein
MSMTERAMYWVRWNWRIQGCRRLLRGLSEDAE